MKILVFGKTGQVARELQRRAGGATIEALDRQAADFEQPAACAAHVARTDAAAIIIAAAWTAVDATEAEEERAGLVNAETPGAISRAAAVRGLPVVHISTDYVFDGVGTAPFAPGHATAPLGAYGRTKARGEALLRAAGGAHAILRTSWVFSTHGCNFVTAVLRLGAERERLGIVADQVGGRHRRCLPRHRRRAGRRSGQERHLSFLRRPGGELGRFRARDICPGEAALRGGRHHHRRLSRSRRAAAQFAARKFAHPRGLSPRAPRLAHRTA